MRPGYVRIVNNCVDNLSPTHGVSMGLRIGEQTGPPPPKKMGWYFPQKRVVPLKNAPPKKALSHCVLLEESCALRGTPKSVGPQPPGAEGRSSCLRSFASSAGYGPTHLTTQKGMIPKKMGQYPPKKTGPPPTLERASNRPSGAVRSRANRLMFMSGFFQTGTPPQSRAKGDAAPEKRMETPPLIRKNIRKFGLPSGLQPGGKLREGPP